MKTFCLALMLLLPLAATADSERQHFTCDNGSRIELSVANDADGRPHATLYFADGNVVLPQVPAAAGAYFRNDAVRLHLLNDDARLEDAKGNARLCHRGDQTAAATPAPAASSSFVQLAGKVFWQTLATPPQARLVVRVVDLASKRTLAELQGEIANQPSPLAFSTLIDRDLLGKKSRLVVRAHIEQSGKRLWAGEKAWKPSTPADIELKALARAPR
jgi:putative lipoprotein